MHYAKRRKKSIKYLSTIFLNDFLHNIPAFLHVGGQFELGSGAVEVLSLVADVKVVVALQIIGEEAHTTFHRHQFGTPRQGLLFQRGERFTCCLQEALGVNFKQFHGNCDRRAPSGRSRSSRRAKVRLAAYLCTNSNNIPGRPAADAAARSWPSRKKV